MLRRGLSIDVNPPSDGMTTLWSEKIRQVFSCQLKGGLEGYFAWRRHHRDTTTCSVHVFARSMEQGENSIAEPPLGHVMQGIFFRGPKKRPSLFGSTEGGFRDHIFVESQYFVSMIPMIPIASAHVPLSNKGWK